MEIHNASANHDFMSSGSSPAAIDNSLLMRMECIERSQTEYQALFANLMTIIEQLKTKYSTQSEASLSDNHDSDVLSMASRETPLQHFSSASSSPSSSSHDSLKRKWPFDDSDYYEPSSPPHPPNDYPKVMASNHEKVILGPNGTVIDRSNFDEITWDSTAAVATRSLLGFIFDSVTLATHTLTGKPSPAFYGRERPLKMRLDPEKIADIIYCVRAKCGGNQRDVRAAITTKCADSAKKHKRRQEKKFKRV